MAATPALDLDLVRTLVLIAEEKSFTRVAERVGRTQSAVSLQVQRLEAQVGRTLVARSKGGGVELTPHGEELVERGRALLALNDEIVRSVQNQKSHEVVRLGVDEGFTRRCLPDILARFATTNPSATVEVSRAASCELTPRLKSGDLDLMLCEGGLEPRQWPAIEVWRGPLCWIVSDAHGCHRDDLCRYRCRPEIARSVLLGLTNAFGEARRCGRSRGRGAVTRSCRLHQRLRPNKRPCRPGLR
jgi:DNA-binding transcriptional LysR family regulator